MSRFTVRLLAIIVIAVAAAAQLSAQPQVHCPCPDVNIFVSPLLTCRVHVCTVAPDGTEACFTFAPGAQTTIPCIPGMQIIIVDGCNVRHNIGVGDCFTNLPGPAPCCVDVCLSQDQQGAGCLGLRFGPGDALHCNCPGG